LIHFFVAAATSIHIPDPASMNETTHEVILDSDTDQQTQQTSMEDEDPNEEVVDDLDVTAKVILPSRIRKINFSLLLSCC
jgi:hypothetical protein